MLARANHHLRDGDFAGFLQDLAQKCIGAPPSLQRFEIIRLVEIDRADFRAIDEVGDVDGLGRLDVGINKVLVR